MDQVPLARKRSVHNVGEITSDLIHPQSIRTCGNTSDLDAARGDLDEEQNHVSAQSLWRPDFHGKEIGCDDLFPVPGQELFPGRFADSVRRRLNAVAL